MGGGTSGANGGETGVGGFITSHFPKRSGKLTGNTPEWNLREPIILKTLLNLNKRLQTHPFTRSILAPSMASL